jgi:hypothetical protein
MILLKRKVVLCAFIASDNALGGVAATLTKQGDAGLLLQQLDFINRTEAATILAVTTAVRA